MRGVRGIAYACIIHNITGCGEKEPEYPEYEPPKNCDVVLETEKWMGRNIQGVS